MAVIRTVHADAIWKLQDSLANHYPKKLAKPVPDRRFEREARRFPAKRKQGLAALRLS
jgi:hypothetical protein